jgi:hypothetical protein
MTFWIVFGVFLFIIGWLLLAPLYVYISTSEARYEAGMKGVVKASVSSDERGIPEISVRLLFFRFRIPVFTFKEKKIRAESKKKRRKKLRKLAWKRIRLFAKIGWRIFRSFKLRQLKLNIDTGDVIRNAYLIPVFAMGHRDRIRLSINYEEKNEFILHFENNLGTIVTHAVSTYIKHILNK